MDSTVTPAKTPTPASQPEWLSDQEIETLSAELGLLPLAWFNPQPSLMVGDASTGKGQSRWAALQQINGPTLSLQLGIWKAPEGFIVTSNPEDGVWDEWPGVATIQDAVRSIGAFIAGLLDQWGLKPA